MPGRQAGSQLVVGAALGQAQSKTETERKDRRTDGQKERHIRYAVKKLSRARVTEVVGVCVCVCVWHGVTCSCRKKILRSMAQGHVYQIKRQNVAKPPTKIYKKRNKLKQNLLKVS